MPDGAAARDAVFDAFARLSELHAPSGLERELDGYLLERLRRLGDPTVDGAGNIVLRIAGVDEAAPAAVLAHKDEIGCLVKRVEEGGRLVLRPVGDAHPWIWGEGPVDVIGAAGSVTGVLSFGARHVSEESPQRAQLDEQPVRWRDVYVETKLPSGELEALGIGVGARAVPARGRKRPTRFGADGSFVASYAIDDKLPVAGLLALAERLRRPRGDVELVFTTREEIGCHGATYYGRRTSVESLIAFEVAPVAKEYAIETTADPVLIVADARGPLDEVLGGELAAVAAAAGVRLQRAALTRYGSDASSSLAGGLVARSACLAIATENTHGYEIAHLDAVERCVDLLDRWLREGPPER